MKGLAHYWDKFTKRLSSKQILKNEQLGYKEFFESKNYYHEMEKRLENFQLTISQQEFVNNLLTSTTHATTRISDLIPKTRLPKQLMDLVPRHLNSHFLGIRLADMTKEELIAALVQCCHGNLV